LDDVPGRIAAGWTMPASGTQSYREGLNAARKELLLRALATTHGNRSAAAKLLGLEAKYFLKLMKSLGIE
jgi:DNA-binding NtrC family response regulator